MRKRKIFSNLKNFFSAQKEIIFALLALIILLSIFQISSNLSDFTLKRQELSKDYYQQGLSALNENDLQKAEEYFEKAHKNNPSHSGYLWQLAITYSRNGKDQKAILCYDKLIEMLPNPSLVYLQKGEIYEKIGQEREALKLYQKAIAIDKNYPKSYLNLANLLLKQGSKAEAKAILQEGLRFNPQSQELKNAFENY